MSINLNTGDKTKAGPVSRKAHGPTFRAIGIPALAAAAMQTKTGTKAKKPARTADIQHETLPLK